MVTRASAADLALGAPDRVVALAQTLWGYQGRVVRRVSADQDYLTDNPSRRCPVIDKARDEVIQIDRRLLAFRAGTLVRIGLLTTLLSVWSRREARGRPAARR